MRNGALPSFIIEDQLKQFIKEDIKTGDITSSLIPANHESIAHIISKSEGIIAGVEIAKILGKMFSLSINPIKNDGDMIQPKDIIMEISGNTRSIVMMERTLLNILMKMSSIASSVNTMVLSLKKDNLPTRIAATRKTTPGFGNFEKIAFVIGGGDTHRMDLSDMVLLKDTHRKICKEDIKKMIEEARANTSFSKKIEVEIEDPAQVKTAIEAGADIIMLDNMKPGQIKEIITKVRTQFPNNRTLFEVSGNIGSDNFMEYAVSGVDIISMSQPIFAPEKRNRLIA